MAVHVQLKIYEGPLDLLLHLIRKNELSIIDIPIASITEQYLEALELMQGLNLDLSGEYLVMAATLLHIKSKMLLPPEEDDDDDNEEPGDSREELIRRLLEYERFKNAAKELEERDILNRDVFARQGRSERVTEISFEQISVFDLMSALQRVLERFPGASVHTVVLETVSVRERMTYILDRLAADVIGAVPRTVRFGPFENGGGGDLSGPAGAHPAPGGAGGPEGTPGPHRHGADALFVRCQRGHRGRGPGGLIGMRSLRIGYGYGH